MHIFSTREKSTVIVPSYDTIIANPQLKALAFYKVVDAYSCFQTISQFIGGVLAKQETTIDRRTDLDKVKQHGFDEKYGFRKRPKKK